MWSQDSAPDETGIEEFARLVCECYGNDQVSADVRKRIGVLIAEFVAQETAADAATPLLIAALDIDYERGLRSEAADAIGKVCLPLSGAPHRSTRADAR